MAEQEQEEQPEEEEAPQEEEEAPKEEEEAPKEEEEAPKEEEEAPKEEEEAPKEPEPEVKEEPKAEEAPKEEAKEEPKPKKKGKKKKKKKSSKSEDSGEAQTVWKKLSKQESSINWYLLKLDGKPGKTTNLTFVKEGDGGAAEIADFLKEESKAVYFGLLKCVTTDDSKSVRGKFIYLRFIGSGVKSITKAKLTTSLGKIDDQFPCKHLSLDINEKCADDLTPKKLAVELLRVGGAHKPDKMNFGPNQEVFMKDL
eukprot:11056_1